MMFNEHQHVKDLVAEGGEGRLYSYQGTHMIKIFKNGVNMKEKLTKLKILMTKNLPRNVVKPLELVQDHNGTFIGYMMKKIKGEEIRRLASRKFTRANGITKDHVSNMLVQVKNTLKKLHAQGVYVGDLNDMNILFDDTHKVHFIDIDSWSVSNDHRCTVANDAFKDPNLVKNFFTTGTDAYSFAIIVYKLLTRLHPFGGVLKSNPNMDLVERMTKKISVIRNDDVTIPRMVDGNEFMSTKLLDDLLDIYERDKRALLGTSLDNFNDNLMLCKSHDDYFYAKFNKCPVCEQDAMEIAPITKIGVVGGVPVRLIFSDPMVKILFNVMGYLTVDNMVAFRNSQFKVPYRKGVLYYTNAEGDTLYGVEKTSIHVKTSNRTFTLEKKFNTHTVIRDNTIYFISNGLTLTKFDLIGNETSENTMERVSINNVFDVHDENNYFVCNNYDHGKVVSVSGHVQELENTDKIMEYGIHFDLVSKKWLFIFETKTGSFLTYIFDKTNMVYQSDKIRYVGSLGNLAFYNDLMYKPSRKAIIRFDYKTNQYKEFKVPTVSEGTKLMKKGKKFIAINETEIHEIG